MRPLQRDFAISDCREGIASAMSAFTCLVTVTCSAAWADGFQQIRTFDPNRGFVAGNGSQPGSQTSSRTGSQTSIQSSAQSFKPPAGWSTQQTSISNSSKASNVAVSSVAVAEASEENSSESKHHKHHHKFLIFGHHDDAEQSEENAQAAASTPSRLPVEQTTSQQNNNSQQNNKSYAQGAPVYAPDQVQAVSMPVVVPRTPSPVVPPEPRQKPSMPVVDQSARLPLVQNSGVKPSLAWRTRAWRLANEPDDATTALKHPSKILNCSTDDALGAAANCCRAKGAQIIGQSLPAGQLGVRFTDASNNRSLIIFVAKSLGNNRTLLKACADSDRPQKITLSNELIQQAAAIIDGKGLL